MSALIISTLRDKRLEVAEAIERLERQVDQHRADLAHLEATMRLFDPNAEPETFQPTPPRRRNDWFHPGECRRRIHDVLHDAAGPLTMPSVPMMLRQSPAGTRVGSASHWTRRPMPMAARAFPVRAPPCRLG